MLMAERFPGVVVGSAVPCVTMCGHSRLERLGTAVDECYHRQLPTRCPLPTPVC